MQNLFEENTHKLAPLAERMRPKTLEEFFGQSNIVGEGTVLRRAIEADRLGSIIFYGPPGCGKTTLAGIIANKSNSVFVKLNAVTAGVADAKKVIAEAKKDLEMYGKRTYLLLDECHRWNKAQSDCVLEGIEKGSIIFIGSTTENPYISMTPAIVSRCKVFEFKPLSKDDISKIIDSALKDRENGLGVYNIKLDADAKNHFVSTSGGDARTALTSLELAVLTTNADKKNVIHITLAIAKQSTQGKALSLGDDLYYDMLSAFCKSLRGSDSDAALYWAHRLIKSGLDPMIIARRLVAHSSEDVGLANSQALVVAVSAMEAFARMGAPEGLIPLSHAIIYVSMSPKSNSVIRAMDAVQSDIEKTYRDAVPDHLKNHNYQKEKREAYKYPHDYGGFVEQQYLPDEIKGNVYYIPSDNGNEVKIKQNINSIIRKSKKQEEKHD